MLFGRKKNAPNPPEQDDPAVRRRDEIKRLEEERETLNAEIEALIKDYSRAIGSKEPLKGSRPMGTRPNEYSFWHKKHKL